MKAVFNRNKIFYEKRFVIAVAVVYRAKSVAFKIPLKVASELKCGNSIIYSMCSVHWSKKWIAHSNDTTIWWTYWTLLQFTNKGSKIGSCSTIASFDLLMIEVNVSTHWAFSTKIHVAVSMANWANEIYINDVNSKNNHDTARQPLNRAPWSNLTADHAFSTSMNQAASYSFYARLYVSMYTRAQCWRKWHKLNWKVHVMHE